MSRRKIPRKSKLTTNEDRKTISPKALIIVASAVGAVLIGLAIVTVTVAVQNAKRASENPLLETLPTADPYFFLATSAPPSAEPTTSRAGTAWIQTGELGSSVKMRTQPSTESDPLETRIWDRDEITILSETNELEDGFVWYEIEYDNLQGFVRSDFVVFEEPDSLPAILLGTDIEDEITGETMYSRLVYVSRAADVQVDLTLADDDNFIGRKMYSKDVALIQYSTGQKLAAAADALAKKGYQLVLWDAYRPYSVTVKMYKYVNDPSLLADPKKGSKHNRGAAVDVTLYKNGNPLDMPTDDRVMDTSKASRGSYMTKAQHTLLDILTEAMEDAGFETYYGEWWHFNDSDWEDYPVMDYPLDMF